MNAAKFNFTFCFEPAEAGTQRGFIDAASLGKFKVCHGSSAAIKQL
jgi:hypothetical protein